MDERRNWAGNWVYSAARLHVPGNVEEVCAAVRGAGRIRALGTRHSFNGIADSESEQVSLEKMGRVVGLDAQRRHVTVEAGNRYGDLATYLDKNGRALHNLAS